MAFRKDSGTSKKKLEADALQESDDLPIVARPSTSNSTRNLLSNSIDTNKDSQFIDCKAKDNVWDKCPKVKK